MGKIFPVTPQILLPPGFDNFIQRRGKSPLVLRQLALKLEREVE